MTIMIIFFILVLSLPTTIELVSTSWNYLKIKWLKTSLKSTRIFQVQLNGNIKVNTTAVTSLLTGLTELTNYTVRVRENDEGASPWSQEHVFMTRKFSKLHFFLQTNK